jgi:hypothetical protein
MSSASFNPMSSEVSFSISSAVASADTAAPAAPPASLGRLHARRLREIYRSAGWPCQDLLEIDLLAAGMLHRVVSATGHETLRVSDAGIALLASTLQRNRSALSAHEALVEQVAREMVRAGRVTWRNLSLRALVAGAEGEAARWCMARPDVFSIRNTSVGSYVEPVVHEIKVRRSDLLGDLRNPGKRAAYLDMGGQCWYVLGNDAKGRCIASADEVPVECGVMALEAGRLTVLRTAPSRERKDLSFHVWMALAKATPVHGLDEGLGDLQYLLADDAAGAV